MVKVKRFIIINILIPFIDRIMLTNLYSWYRLFKKMQLWPNEMIIEWQNEKLCKLIDHAYNHCSYYKNLFDQNNLKPIDIKSINDLYKIPPLTKELIRNNYQNIIPNNLQEFKHKKSSTGGTTGAPMKFLLDRNSWSAFNAFGILSWEKTGYFYGEKYVALGSSSIFPIGRTPFYHKFYYWVKGKIALNAINLSSVKMDSYYNFIKNNHINYIYGYASSIYIFAKYIETKCLQNSIQIKVCFTTAELLTEEYRTCILRVFGCKILDCYGASDGALVGYKFKDSGFCVGYNSIAQLADSSLRSGSVYVTDLNNYSFPFIRYTLGDEIELITEKVNYHNSQVIKRVLGRTSDIIELENGRTLSAVGFTVLFKDMPVKAYRVFKSGFLELTILIVKDIGFVAEHEALVKKFMLNQSGLDCSLKIQYTREILQKENGKSLFILN